MPPPPSGPPQTAPRAPLWVTRAAVITLVIILAVTLLPGSAPHEREICLSCSELWATDFVLNVLLFLPLGCMLTAAHNTLARTVAFCAFASLFVECTQFALPLHRYASPLDLVANSLGGVLGAFAWLLGRAWRRGTNGWSRVLALLITTTWSVQCLFAGWALLVRLPEVPSYEARWARPSPSGALFRGTVLDAALHSMPLPDGAVADPHLLRRLVTDSGLALRVRVASLPATQEQVQVFGLNASADWRIASVALLGCSVRARVGTNGEHAGFAAPRLALRDRCVERSPVTMDLRQDGRRFALEVRTLHTVIANDEMQLGPLLGWTLLAPRANTIGLRTVATVAWLVLFSLPVGLFASEPGLWIGRRWLVCVALLLAAPMLSALAFQTSTPSTSQLLTLLVGSVIGAAFAKGLRTSGGEWGFHQHPTQKLAQDAPSTR